jgi:hypothetical protein
MAGACRVEPIPAPDGIDFSVAVVAGLARRAGVAYI